MRLSIGTTASITTFVILAPFVDAGVANSISDTEFFHRPFTSFGYLAHVEAGADVDLTHRFHIARLRI